MSTENVILGDWGTTSLSLSLCPLGDASGGASPQLLKGQGIKFCDDAERHFHNLVSTWAPLAGNPRAYLTGMVGSRLGWHETPYADCPISPADLAAQSSHFTSRGIPITIVAGAKCRNPFGDHDVMRGEEVQVIGTLSQQPKLPGRQLFCLPGTHTKWVLTQDKTIDHFLTLPRGELWEVLSQHSILLDNAAVTDANMDWTTFDLCLTDIRNGRWPNAFSALFGVRAGLVSGAHDQIVAASKLSAILVGFDVQTGLLTYPNIDEPITIIGSPTNASLYQRALSCFGHETIMISGEQAAFAGLMALANLENA